MSLCSFWQITWSLLHSRLRRPLLMEERRKWRPWSAIRKFRSPNQNTTLWERERAMEPRLYLLYNPSVHIFHSASVRALTCGPARLGSRWCQSLASPGCTRTRPRAAERSSCGLLGGSWGSTPCGRRKKNARTLLLYYPNTDKQRRRNVQEYVK